MRAKKASTLLIPGPRVGRSRWRALWADFDWILFFLVSIIVTIGLVNLYSATHATAHSVKFTQQVVRMGLGLGCYFFLTFIDFRSAHRWAWIGHLVMILMILSVQFFFEAVKGSQRWIMLGPMRLQPTELAKLFLIVAVARLLHDWEKNEWGVKEVGPQFVALVIPIALTALQPDLGTASLLTLILLSTCLMQARKTWPFFVAISLGLMWMPRMWNRLHDYQRSRILAFLDPGADPTGAAWQTSQSVKAVGSGQLTGKGFKEATQNHFNFLPEHWTDFPFSVWAEEWGFLGSVAMLLVFLLLILWIVNVALNASGRFGQAICIGVGAMIFWHVLVNILMVTGWAPVVGVPLPLISYGGSSVLTVLCGLGLVSSVSKRRRDSGT